MATSGISGFLYSQLVQSLPYPQDSYEGKTVIVTGSNVGLGKEAARHFARLGAKKLILAVRNLEKGKEAKEDIERTTNVPEGTVQVWELDLSKYESVKRFAARVDKELERLDILVENAGIATEKFAKAEDNESTITVNVTSTFLLALLLLPKLKETEKKFKTKPTLTIVSSEVHAWAVFNEGKEAPEGQILNWLGDESKSNMKDRYQVSKLLEVFAVRAIVEKYPSLPITVNMVNPGLCHSELSRDAGWGLFILKLLLARKTEYGSRTLVHAGTSGKESHGQYLSDCKVASPSAFVLSEEGKKLQERVWTELSKKLDSIQPGVTKNLE